MNCEYFQPDLKAYSDGELLFLKRALLKQHLAGCESCRQEIQVMAKISKTLQQSETAQPISHTLRANILAEAAMQGVPVQNKKSLDTSPDLSIYPERPISMRYKIFAATGLIGLLVIGVGIGIYTHGTVPTFAHFSNPTAQIALSTDMYSQHYNENFPMTGASNAVPMQAIENRSAMDLQAKSATVMPAPQVPSNLPDSLSLDRQVHREASLTVQTSDPEASGDQVSEDIKSAGGYVASNDLTTDDSGIKSAQMSLEVPVVQFDTVLSQIEKMGNVTAKNVTGQDITAKISDAGQTESVLENDVSGSEAHLAAKGRHATWEDEEDARQLRIELAEARARVQLLGKLAQLSEITLTLTQTPKPTPPVQTGMWSDLHGNSSAAFQSSLGALTSVLTVLIWCIAYVPIWGPLILLIWFANKRWGLFGRG